MTTTVIPDPLALAVEAHRQGRVDEAQSAYWEILRYNPTEPSALHLLGVLLSEQGNHAEALALLSLSVRLHPRPAESAPWICNLGIGLERAGQIEAALSAFRQAAALDKAYAEALLRFGRRQCTPQSPAGGRAAFEAATETDPASAPAWFHLGVTAMVTKEFDVAHNAFQRAVSLHPGHHEAWNNLGDLEVIRGFTSQAIDCYHRAIAADPAYVPARYNLALTLQNAERIAEAESAYLDLLTVDPNHADTLNNLGAVRLSQNRVHEAIEILSRGATANLNHIDTRWNLGLAHLTLGEFAPGWAGYEARTEQRTFPKKDFKAPRWSGQDLSGKSIHVWAEQGLGDTIQFLRYLPLLSARGARVSFECQERLYPLLQNIALTTGAVRGAIDYHSPLMSLPSFFDGIPPVWNPLAVPRMPEVDFPGFRVGLCWGANLNHTKGRHRSAPLAAFSPLGEIPNCTLVALQQGPQLTEIDELGGWKPIVLERQDGTVAELAALISSLDLVISVDTMVAHLSATLGKPTWTLLPFAADWRWMLDRDDSPWYPRMRLFRQPEPGNWAAVVRSVSAALRNHAGMS